MGDDITIGVTEIVNNIEVTAQPNDQIVDISVIDNADEVTLNITPTVIEINVNKGSSYARWGTIYGNLTDQTDLQNALLLKADLVDGKVPAYQLPSFVDDIIEVANYAALPATGEIGKIYVTLDNNKIYRWSGSVYIEIAANNAIWGAITGTLSNQTDLVNALNLRVPYTGATSNVNLGEYGLTSGFLGLDTTPTSTPTGIGTIYWDAANRTAALIDGDGDTTLQIGQEQRILVHNNTGSTLTDGQVVYVTGSTGNVPSVSLANASSETTSAATIGVVTESIANGANGFITTSGIVNGLNTLAFNEGDLLWLGTTAGTFTATKPISPNHLVLIGYVIKKAGGNGSILVKIQNTQELEESSDVLFTSLANNQVLTYESATDLWKNKSIATILGYTPANDASVVKLTGDQSITGSKSFTTNTTAPAMIVTNNSTDNGILLQNTSTGNALRINNGALSTGDLIRAGKEGNVTFIVNQNGNTTAASFIKSGGTSSQFLKADGSVDSSTYSLDNAVVHLTGNETISGVKTLQNTLNLTAGVNIDDAYGFYWKTNVGEIETALAGIGQSSSGLNFFTGSSFISPRMFINSSGNVGIGTTSPLTNLTVKGSGINTMSLQYSNDGGGVGYGIYNSSGTELFSIGGGRFVRQDELSISRQGTSVIYINNSNNLGIGTTSPANKLEVSTSGTSLASFTGAEYSQFNIIGGTQNFYIQNYNSVSILGTKGASPLLFTTNETERMRITSGGNVGIGTTSPTSPLHVKGSGSYAGVIVDNTGTTGGGYFAARQNGSQVGIVGVSGAIIGDTSSNMALFSETGKSVDFMTDGSATIKMRITSGGNVGIGNTASTSGYKLQVSGLQRMIGSSTVLNFGELDANNNYFQSLGTDNSTAKGFVFYGSGEYMRITSGGNVGIGNTSPSTKLDVTGAITASGGFFNSDMRLKYLTDYDYNVSDIKPITYFWKDGRDNKKHVGYSAQEVQKVMPDAVNEGTDGMLSVNYVEVLVAKIAELENRIKQLEK